MPTASDTKRRPATLDDILARAVVWHYVALGLSAPDANLKKILGESRRALEEALKRLELSPYTPGPTVALDVRFTEVFGHTPRAAVCPYETEYGPGRVFQQTQELADLRGWYAAFGLERREDRAERADHLGVECEFAGFLCLKQAAAMDAGDDAELDVAYRAYRRFLRDHLARFGVGVSGRIERVDGDGFYGRLAVLCRELLIAECRGLDIEPGPRALSLRPDSEDDIPAACGAGASVNTSECEGSSPLGRSAPGRLLSLGGGE